jgi:hypothetical protein
VYLNNGTALFQDSGQDLGDEKLSGNYVDLVDIDGDDDLDAMIRYYQHTNGVYLNDGQGNFSLSEITFPDFTIWGDLDTDGDIDYFYKQENAGYYANLNDGSGNFTENWSYADTDAMIHGAFILGDIDNDGDLDAVVTNGDFRSTALPTLVFINDGSGAYTIHDQQLATLKNSDISLGDLNGDTYPDLILTDFENPVQIWFNNGNGGFYDSGIRLNQAQFYRSAPLTDLDGDGDLDIFLADYSMGGGPNQVWYNQLGASSIP